MTPSSPQTPPSDSGTQHMDVLIVGAGLTGIGTAHRIQATFPAKSYTVLEARDVIGGTWDLFRYPGVRSDSDMQTLGYRFRPWTQRNAIADGQSILAYIRQTAADAGIDQHIRFGHRVRSASWSSAEARWTVEVIHGAGAPVLYTCDFLFMCGGYYRYDQGYTPAFEGIDQFTGQVVHPQHWPAGLDYTGKQVVVIGSGATAVTLVPTMAQRARHVTMVQRSPTYIVSVPAEDPIANGLRRVLGSRASYAITRWKNVLSGAVSFQLGQRRPRVARALIRSGVKRQLPADYDVDTHFNPRYKPWDQRMCLVPDGDLFNEITAGRASVVTDRIETFTPTGLRLASGAALDADIVVTATGLNLLAFGGIRLTVDGQDVSVPDSLAYRGLMLEGVPNFAFSLGYTNASWTLKVDLVTEYVCRLLAYMDRHGHRWCVPVNGDRSVTSRPLLDFAAGYVQRSVGDFPKSGSRAPWRLGANYVVDLLILRLGRLRDGVLQFSGPGVATDSARGAEPTAQAGFRR